MPYFEKLPEPVLDVIAQKVSERLFSGVIGVSDALGTHDLRIFESMDVWILEAAGVLRGRDDLASISHRTERWQHQIKSGDVAVGFATSLSKGPEPQDWSVV